jgi:peptidoglycan/LPS O-acetylase OafA/YrhL
MLHDSVLPAAFAALIYGIGLRPRWLTFLEFKPLVLLGEASYSFYLLHSTAIGMYFFTPQGTVRALTPVVVTIGLLIPVAASLFVYFLIEQPGRRWLKPKPKMEAALAAAEA